MISATVLRHVRTNYPDYAPRTLLNDTFMMAPSLVPFKSVIYFYLALLLVSLAEAGW